MAGSQTQTPAENYHQSQTATSDKTAALFLWPALQVKGRRMDVNSAIRTRSRAKQQAEQWQMVPLPAKLLAMLTDTVTESRAQKAAGMHRRFS